MSTDSKTKKQAKPSAAEAAAALALVRKTKVQFRASIATVEEIDRRARAARKTRTDFLIAAALGKRIEVREAASAAASKTGLSDSDLYATRQDLIALRNQLWSEFGLQKHYFENAETSSRAKANESGIHAIMERIEKAVGKIEALVEGLSEDLGLKPPTWGQRP